MATGQPGRPAECGAPFAFRIFGVAFPMAEGTGTLPRVRGVWAGRVRLWDVSKFCPLTCLTARSSLFT